MMEKYPLNPWAFVIVFVGLIMASSLEEMSVSPLVREIALYAPGLALFLQFVWSWQAVRFISATFEPATKFKRRFEFLLKLAAGGMVVVVIGTFFGDQLITASAKETASAVITIFGMIVGAIVIAVFWTAAAALCTAEDGMDTPLIRVAGALLLFMALGISAPFIYRRLEALDLSQSRAARTNFGERPIR